MPNPERDNPKPEASLASQFALQSRNDWLDFARCQNKDVRRTMHNQLVLLAHRALEAALIIQPE